MVSLLRFRFGGMIWKKLTTTLRFARQSDRDRRVVEERDEDFVVKNNRYLATITCTSFSEH